MSVQSVSTSSTQSECLRCTRDKHSPKLYSSANNMNPGVVPPQLMVRFYTSATLCACVALRCLRYVALRSFGSQFRVIAVAQIPGNSPVAHLATDQRNGEQ